MRRLGLLLERLGRWLSGDPERYARAHAWDLWGRLWEVRAPAWSPGGVRVRPDVVRRARKALAYGQVPDLPVGWEAVLRERGRARR